MSILFRCALCGIMNKASDEAAGLLLSCSGCGKSIRVPIATSKPLPKLESAPSPFPALPIKRTVIEPTPAPLPWEKPKIESVPGPPASTPRPIQTVLRHEPLREEAESDEEGRRGRHDPHYDFRERNREDPPRGNSAALGLGVSSLVIGVLSLFPAIVPCCGAIFAIPMAGIALLLGAAGLTVSLIDGRRSIGLPITGTAISAVALAITAGWMILLAGASSREAKARVQKAEKTREESARIARKAAEAEKERKNQEEEDTREREIRQREDANQKEALEKDKLAKAKADSFLPKPSLSPAEVQQNRRYDERVKEEAEKNLQAKADAEAEESRQSKAKADAEAEFEKAMVKEGLSENDRRYVLGCINNRWDYDRPADAAKQSLIVTKALQDGAVGVPQYSNRFLDPRYLGTSSYMKIAQIISKDEMVIYPGYVSIKGISTVGLTAGLQDGSRINLKEKIFLVDGTTTYKTLRGEKDTARQLFLLDFQKIEVAMEHDALKKLRTAINKHQMAKAEVARCVEVLRKADLAYKAELARREEALRQAEADYKAELERREAESVYNSPEAVAERKAKAERERARIAKEEADRKAREEYNVNDLVLLNSTVKGVRGDFTTTITGTVVNRRTKDLKFVQITFNIYDETGAKIGTAFAIMRGLDSGERWNFKAVYFGRGEGERKYKVYELAGR